MSEGNKGKITTRRAVLGAGLAAVGLAALKATGMSAANGEAPKSSAAPKLDKRVVLPMAARSGLLTDWRVPPPPEKAIGIGRGEVVISLAWQEKTNMNDARVRANIEEDFASVKALSEKLPVLGYPGISLSAQDRYGYDFKAVDDSSIGRYNESPVSYMPDYIFLNMEVRDLEQRKHLVWHELGGHYLDPEKSSTGYLAQYLTVESRSLAIEAKQKLLGEIRRYKGRPAQSQERKERHSRWGEEGVDKNGKPIEHLRVNTARSASSVELDAWSLLEDKFANKQQVTWDEIVNASNVYPQDVWEHPTEFLRFKDMVGRDSVKIQAAADKELYAEFTAYLLRAQDLGLFDSSYKHPVLEPYWDLKRAAGQVGKK